MLVQNLYGELMLVNHQPSSVALRGAPGLHSPGLQNESDTAEGDHL